MKKEIMIWKKVFGNWRYSFSALFIALIFYLFNVFISSYQSLSVFYESSGLITASKLFFTFSISFGNRIAMHSFISLIIVSLLIGVLSSLIIYKIKNSKLSKKKTGLLASTGAFLAAFAPGCAACGVGLASVLGIGGATLALLPFEGLELSIIAIIILGIAVKKTSKDLIGCPTCKVNLKLMKGGKKYD